MKSFFQFVVVAPACLILLGSCDPAKEFAAEIKTIDSCQAVLNNIDSLYNGIEFDSLEYMISHVKKNEKLMKSNYDSDTINMELGMLMNNSKGIRKSIKDPQGNKKKFGEEIAAMKTQLTNLKTDVLNGVYDKEQINTYLAKEKADLDKLNLTFTEFYSIQKEQSWVYYMVVPKVDEYVKLYGLTLEDTLE